MKRGNRMEITRRFQCAGGREGYYIEYTSGSGVVTIVSPSDDGQPFPYENRDDIPVTDFLEIADTIRENLGKSS